MAEKPQTKSKPPDSRSLLARGLLEARAGVVVLKRRKRKRGQTGTLSGY